MFPLVPPSPFKVNLSANELVCTVLIFKQSGNLHNMTFTGLRVRRVWATVSVTKWSVPH